jgi:hypothetical protein
MTALHRTKWFLPLFSVALGLVFLGALWVGGERRAGFESLAVMFALGLLILFGGRSELIRGLRGMEETSIGSESTSMRPCSPGTSRSA